MKKEELSDIFKDFDTVKQNTDVNEAVSFFMSLYERIDDNELVDEIIRQFTKYGNALSSSQVYLIDKLLDDSKNT